MSSYTIVESEDYRGYQLTVRYDEFPPNPREDDNIWHFAFRAYQDKDLKGLNYNSIKSLATSIRKKYKVSILVPIYKYEHSMVRFETYKKCQFDSGLIGYAFLETNVIKSEQLKTKKKALEILQGELDTYSDYINGEVFCYEVLDSNGDLVDGCYGYYLGDLFTTEDMLKEARSCVDYVIERDVKQLTLYNQNI